MFDVDYSLAPEYRYPAAFDDCYNALGHIWSNADKYGIDKKKIAIGGASAGGNLAATVALRDRDEKKHRVTLQVVMNPATMQTKASCPADFKWTKDDYDFSGTATILENTITDPRENDGLDIMFKAYIGEQDPTVPYVSPSMATDFSGLPKTIITTSEYDTLRHQGEYFGGQLLKAGVDTTIYRYNGIRHEDVGNFGFVPQAEDLANIIATALKTM